MHVYVYMESLSVLNACTYCTEVEFIGFSVTSERSYRIECFDVQFSVWRASDLSASYVASHYHSYRPYSVHAQKSTEFFWSVERSCMQNYRFWRMKESVLLIWQRFCSGQLSLPRFKALLGNLFPRDLSEARSTASLSLIHIWRCRRRLRCRSRWSPYH